jgi:CHAT domain-containing protein/Tfp pilus assembly protein PilF
MLASRLFQADSPKSSTALTWSLEAVSALLLFFAATSVPGQTASNPAQGMARCVDLKPGIVVESVAKNSEAEKAGLVEGDVLLTWKRGDLKGEIRSPFDLSEIEIEQEPRGQVTLEGTRGEAKETWAIGPDKWGLGTRPNLPDSLLTLYQDSQHLAKAGKLAEAAQRWRTSADEGGLRCSWLSSWLLSHAAEMFAGSQQWGKSDALYEEAIQRSENLGPNIKGQLLQAQVGTFQQRSDWPDVVKYGKQALAQSQQAPVESLALARRLNALGVATFRLSDFAESEKYHRQALAIRQRLAPGSLDVAASLNNLGNVAYRRSDLAAAGEYYQQSIAIKQTLNPESLDLASTLNNLANVVADRGELAQAEAYDLRALAIRGELAPASLDVAMSLNNLGDVAYFRGDLAKADQYYEQALTIKLKLGPVDLDVALGLQNLGNVAEDRGDIARAEEYHRQALTLRQRLAPASLDVAESLTSLGNVAYERGDLNKAGDYYNQSLAIKRRLALTPDSLQMALDLNNLGDVAYASRDLAKAKDYNLKALAIRKKMSPGGPDTAMSLYNLGTIADSDGDLAKAEEFYNGALAVFDKLEPGGLHVASCLQKLGRVAENRNDLTTAERYYSQSLMIRKKLAPDGADYAESLGAMAAVLRSDGKTDEALKLFAESTGVLDRQLARLGGSPEVRAGYRAKHTNYYFDYADLLVVQKRLALAFEVLEQSRARTLLEMLAEARIDIRQGADAELIDRERLLQATLTAKTNRKISLLEGNHTSEQRSEAEKETEEALNQYQELEEQIRASSPRYAGLTQPQPLRASEVQQQLLDPDTVLLDYALGAKRSLVFVVTPTSLDSYALPNRVEIEATARRTYDLLTARNRRIAGETIIQHNARVAKDDAEYKKTSATLSQMVLGPVAQRLTGKRLLIVADGAMQYIPFAALPVPAADLSKATVPLVAEHEIVNLPSASVLALLRQQAKERVTQPTKEVAILADPVFDKSDPRVVKAANPASAVNSEHESEPIAESTEHLTRSIQDVDSGPRHAGAVLPRLAFSRREAAAIMAVTKPGASMEALDFDASRETALSKELGQYQIVHFATHGLLDNEHPELSGLVFSLVGPDGKPRDGFLDLQDVFNLTIPADLVVLSACETGLGKEISGEGLVGLTRGFMYAGANRVVASLWNVDDVATSELMTEFYKGMLQAGLRPAAALRQAQIEMLNQKRWKDPYYWAAFTIQGEWK